MDPDACFSMFLECLAAEEWSDAADRAADLMSWLRRGGFPPGGGRLSCSAIEAVLDWSMQQSM